MDVSSDTIIKSVISARLNAGSRSAASAGTIIPVLIARKLRNARPSMSSMAKKDTNIPNTGRRQNSSDRTVMRNSSK